MEGGALGNWISAAATVVTAIVAIVAVAYARRQVEMAQQSTALTTWDQYLRLCFDHPTYSSGDLVRPLMKDQTFRSVWDQGTEASEKYLWFLSITLNSCEKVLLNIKAPQEWWDTLAEQVEYHAEAMEELWPRWRKGYSEQMDRLVQDGLARASNAHS